MGMASLKGKKVMHDREILIASSGPDSEREVRLERQREARKRTRQAWRRRTWDGEACTRSRGAGDEETIG